MIVMLSHDAPIVALAIMLALQQAGHTVVVNEVERIFPEYVYGIEAHDLHDVDAMEFIITNGTGAIQASEDSHMLSLLLAAGSIVPPMRSTARIRDGPIR